MNQDRRGFVSIDILLAIILGIVVIGGGAYFATYMPHDAQVASNNLPEPQTASSSKVMQPSTISSSTSTLPSSPAVSSGPPQPIVANTGTPTGSIIGYIWETGPGDPNFSSVELPIFVNMPGAVSDMPSENPSTATYYIYIYKNGAFTFYKETPPVKEVVFPSGGVSKFEVLGVDPHYGICVVDRGYAFGIRFASSGTFTGKKIYLTTDSPNQRCKNLDRASKRAASGDDLRLMDLQLIQFALEFYNQSFGYYPSQLSTLVPKYLSNANTLYDPNSHVPYLYAGLASATTTSCVGYHLGAPFKDQSDPQLLKAAHAMASSQVCTGSKADFFGTGTILDVTNASDPYTLH